MSEISDDIRNFASVAERYCAWAEQPAKAVEDEMVIAQLLLSELHLAVIELNDIGCGVDTNRSISHDEWGLVLDRFQELPLELYWGRIRSA